MNPVGAFDGTLREPSRLICRRTLTASISSLEPFEQYGQTVRRNLHVCTLHKISAGTARESGMVCHVEGCLMAPGNQKRLLRRISELFRTVKIGPRLRVIPLFTIRDATVVVCFGIVWI